MVKINNENQARYQVVTLLYQGKFDEARVALATFAHSGKISRENEIFYRFLLQAAMRRLKSMARGTSRNRKWAFSERKDKHPNTMN